ncbi:MAG TPA: rod shape-determining protein MreC [Kofleriaceae bacterium]|nr:rod shape-determining protein MreC [Kofleriaceae bacterium]
MRARRKIFDYCVAVALLLLPLALLRAHLRGPEELSGLDRAVLRISAPLQAGVSWIVEGVGSVWNRYVWLVDVEEENEQLREANSRLRHQLAVAGRHVADTAKLERLLGLKEHQVAEVVGARVIASSLSAHFRVTRIRLDRGQGQVAPGMTVVSAEGLVGRIFHVYGDYADVLLTTDPQSSIDVLVPRTGGRGVLTGLGEDGAYACTIEYLEKKSAVIAGDTVVTSGLGSAFPAGLLVGHVASVKDKSYGLYQKVVVTPSIDFAALTRVLVLVPPPPADPDGGAGKGSPPAHEVRPL